MDRVEIKKLAKEKIKGNVFNILWPILVIGAISSLLTGFLEDDASTISQILLLCVSFLSSIFSICYYAYLMEFVRTGKSSFNTIIEFFKKNFVRILLLSILLSVFTVLLTLLFIVPGIIFSYACSMVCFLLIDTDLGPMELIKESCKMMKGYKWDYFVFNFSFIGWVLLGILTFGILYFWLTPYIYVAQYLYYEKLKEKNTVVVSE